MKQALRPWYSHVLPCLIILGFQQFSADACIFGLIEKGRVATIAVEHVDNVFAVGLKSRCDNILRQTEPHIPRQELGGTEMIWRLPLLTGPGEGYSENIS